MDKQSTTGIILIVLFVLVWSIFFAPEPEQKPDFHKKKNTNTEQIADSSKQDTLVKNKQEAGDSLENVVKADTISKDSLELLELKKKYGVFAKLIKKQEDKTLRIKTGKLDFLLHSKGGRIEPLYLSEYKTYDGAPLMLVPPHPKSNFSLTFASEGKFVRSEDFFFELPDKGSEINIAEDSTRIVLKAKLNDKQYLAYTYTFYKDKFDVNFSVEIVGLKDLLNNPFYEINQYVDVPRTEKDAEMMRAHTTIYYKYGGDVESLSPRNDEPEKETVQGSIEWICLRSQFFNHTIIPEKPFEIATLEVIPHPEEEKDFVKKLHYTSQIPIQYDNQGNSKQNYKLYYGPNDFYVLSSYEIDLEDILELGWGPIRWVNRFIIIPTFKFLEKFIPSYGVIIFILALFIKLIFSPLTFKSYVGTAKMQIANQMPEMKALEEKYKDDPQKLQVAKFQLQKRLGVNMFAGCLPNLVQFPVLIAMFYFFPASIELRQKSFLWAEDLSTYDSFFQLPFELPFIGSHISLFTLLMTLTSVGYMYIQQKSQGNTGNPQMKYMSYFMPIVFFFVFNRYPAALSYYYLLANVITIGQTMVIKKFFINEEEITKQLRANLKKNKGKKSRLELMMEQAQRQQKRRRK